MKTLNVIIGGVMILIGLFIIYMAVNMFVYAFRDISGYLQGALITAIGLAIAYFGYKRARKE